MVQLCEKWYVNLYKGCRTFTCPQFHFFWGKVVSAEIHTQMIAILCLSLKRHNILFGANPAHLKPLRKRFLICAAVNLASAVLMFQRADFLS